MRLFDTHCHLDDDKLRDEASALLDRASLAGVKGICGIMADLGNFDHLPTLCKELQKKHPSLKVIWSAGLHPHEAKEFNPQVMDRIRELALEANAIGETGLDYHYNMSEPAIQKTSFDAQIELAAELKKPLVIHCREAADDVLEMLDRPSLKASPTPGILHCFTETLEVAKRLVDLNFMISFSGILTFNNAESLREVAKWVPLENLLIETDSPYLAPKPFRGKQNEPAFVQHTFEALAQIKGLDREELQTILWKNSCRTYHLNAGDS